MLYDGVLLAWPNTAVQAQEAKRTGRWTRARFATANEIANSARPVTHAGGLADALRRVTAAADGDFKVEAREFLRLLAARLPELTSEDVLDAMNATTHDNRAMGPIMLWGVRQHLIAKTDPERFVPSAHPDRHNADLRVWRSVVYQRDTE
jgi:hypothetical protein